MKKIIYLLMLTIFANTGFANTGFASKIFANADDSAAKTNNLVQSVQSGGRQAWLAQDNSLPIVLINIDFLHSGSAYDAHAGTVQLLASMLGEGAGKYSAMQFSEELEQYAIQFGASASRDVFSIRLKTLKENLPKTMELLQAALASPHFADDDLARIKLEHLASIKAMNESPEFHLQQLFYEKAFAANHHPYARPPYGDAQSVKAIDAGVLKQFMQTNLVQNRMKISITGDVDAEAVKHDILPFFDKLPSNNSTQQQPLVNIAIPQLDTPQHHAMEVPQTSINLVYNGINRNDKLFYASYVLQHIIGGSSLSSKLGQVLREENGLVYGVSAGFAQADYANWFTVGFATKTESKDLAIKLAKQVIAKVAAGEISQTELQAAKDYLMGSFALETDSNLERLQFLSMMQRYDLGLDYLQKRNSLIEAVSLAQLVDVAKRLNGEPLMVLTVGK